MSTRPCPRRLGSSGWLLAGAILWACTALAKPAVAASNFCPFDLPPLAPSNIQGPETVLTADEAELTEETAHAQGNVRLERQNEVLLSPQLSYNRNTSRVRTDSGLQYLRPGLYLTAAAADYDIDSSSGEFTRSDYILTQHGGRGEARHVLAIDQDHYTLQQATYTTCPGDTKAWLLKANKLKVNRDSGRATAYNTILRFYNVPIFYTPYLNFPIDDRRHTGLLTPTVGYSGSSGFELAAPVYLNLAPNYDATVTPRILGQRGLQIESEFRYLSRHHRGIIEAAGLAHDRKYGSSRGLVDYRHAGKLSQHVGLTARYAAVSDDEYFEDLSHDIDRTSETHLQRNLHLYYENTGLYFGMLAESFQSLGSSTPYHRLPQLRMELESPTAPFYVGLESEFTRFQKNRGIDTQRTDVRPHLNWTIDHGGWYANSEAALRYTRYHFNDHLTNSPATSIDRTIPSFSLGGGLRLLRSFGNGWLQTLEPRVQYLYKGYEDQSEIPLFDTGVPDLHFNRLFAQQRFIGSDRIVDVNQLALGVSSRLLEPNSGRTVLKFDLGRIHAFHEPRVQLPGNAQTGFHEGNSDYVAGVEYRPTRNLRTGIIAQYSPSRSKLNRAFAHIDYHNDAGYRVNLAWRRYENFRPMGARVEALEQTTVGLALPLGERLDFVGRWNYSLEKSQNVGTAAGLEYRPSCCWAARLSWQRIVAHRDGSYDNALMFQFVLRGLSAIGSSARTIEERSIFSYLDSRRGGFSATPIP